MPKSDYAIAEDHILRLAENLSVKERIHMASLLLTGAALNIQDKRTKRMIESLAADVAKLETETRE